MIWNLHIWTVVSETEKEKGHVTSENRRKATISYDYSYMAETKRKRKREKRKIISQCLVIIDESTVMIRKHSFWSWESLQL